ncbi:branched-chain amino acid ABC transporter permease [Rhizobium alvei]|uniref:Branched-chain amino acid ABC transporter permease n=1 Tax=Rhizobium alvei TaxID=1132659 RepID=A0ABT8YGT1_9HYPH|nr:branched-chain amino acid ABC transporter permease [Rhizobium alvei]MDO6962885.1 branched-chain amino acid ABC transporter permease [Rhizobium alvei]
MSKPALRVTLGLIVIAAILASAPLWAGRSDLRLIGEIMSYLALAVLWNLLAGYAGLVSTGQQAFVGLGGYTLFICVIWLGLPPIASIAIAAIAGGLVGWLFAPLLFRLEGAYFAIGTWVAAETVSLVFGAIPSLGAGAGMSLPTSAIRSIAASRDGREIVVYLLLVFLGLGILAGTYALIRSKAGLALMALRDNGLAAASVGVDIWRTRLWTYIAVSAATGAIGAVIFLQKVRISPDAAFSMTDWTVIIVFIVVIGGIGRLEGAIVGTLVYFFLRELLSDYGTIYLIVLGLVAILVMTFSRTGLWGLVEQKLGWSLMPTRRRRS